MRLRRLLALLLPALLLLAACGGDDDTTAASGTAPSASDTAPSEDSSSAASSPDGGATATTAASGTAPSADSSSAASSSDEGAAATSYPLVIESCGFTSTLDAPPERIVVYYDLVEPLLAWGLGDKIVGWHTYNSTSLYPGMNELMAELDITGEPWPRETLTALEPDLVITASAWAFNTEAGFLSREELAEAGAATYIPASLCAQDRADATDEEKVALSNRGFDDMIAELADLGAIVDKQAEAAALIDELTTKMDEVEAAIGDVEPVRTAVLAVDSTGETIWGVYVGGSNEDYITRAGGVNPFRDPAEQFKSLSIEELTNVPLDVLLIDSDGTEERNQTALATFPTWPAFENGRVGNVPGLVTSSLGTPWTVEQLAKLLHPSEVSRSGAAATSYPLVIESCGFTSTLDAPPERIVVYYDLVEPLLAWGLGDKIVGWHTYNSTSLYPGMNELMAELDITGEPWPRETLTALEPDLVITASAWAFNTEAGFLSREELAEAGAATYIPASLCAQDRADATDEEKVALSNRGFDDMIAELADLGVIVDKQAAAAALIDELTTKMDEVEAAIGDVEPVRTAVLAVDSTGETIWGVYVGGSNEDYITRAGGVNPFRDPAEQFKSLSIEELTNVPLDVLLIDSDGTEERNQTALATFPTWPAFENGRVGNVPGLVTSSLGTPWTVEQLAKLLHPSDG